jgi:uncharacterized protein (DUF1499 family)
MDPALKSPRQAGWAATAARLALVIAALSATAALLAGPIYRLEVLPLGMAIGEMRGATIAALCGAAIGLIAALASLRLTGAPARVPALAALVLNLIVAAPPLWMYREAQRLPRIHDISTDTANPPAFVAVLPRRQGARNPVDYKADTAAQQKAGYPDIAPLTLALPPAQAFARAEQAARAMGWQIVDAQLADGRIEATDTTPLFGFRDDVVVRIAPSGAGSVVDVRSLSRVGGSDFGTNAKRVRAFLQRMTG